ncbi:MAG: capsular biosynthesis protein CpsI, partial [Gammaproteobacteria bacterium]|nr:capsular biosynthesis protein CpsI [Gammaproteobacteria bacterium]
DFTYIDDIVEGVVRVIDNPPVGNPDWSGDAPDSATSYAPWRVFNIGNGRPVKLMRYIELIEETLGKKAILDLLPMQDGDVPSTVADTTELGKAVGYQPDTTVDYGVPRFVEWYCSYFA